ncbi:MAG: FHA domain-containing protein [Planctomycetaceae bacterium]|nr:FHA domain-containing protein [Planctomycetaceae bacterium]
MATISLQVIQGLERGQYYSDLNVPVTIGREDDNSIQLNDERISRCHLKIQVDHDKVILTDLESTNGSRVNGLPVQMTVLNPGDLISLGRCILMYGSHEEIQAFCSEQHKDALNSQSPDDSGNTVSGIEGGQYSSDDFETLGLFDEHGEPAVSFPSGSPPLPRTESLASRSELADLLNYLHSRILQVLESRGQDSVQDEEEKESPTNPTIPIPRSNWFQLLNLEAELSRHLKEISEPE